MCQRVNQRTYYSYWNTIDARGQNKEFMEIQNLTKISETCKPYICDKCPTFYFPSRNSALSIVSNFEIFLEDIHLCTLRARTIWEWIVARARMSDVWVSRLCLLHKSSHVWD